jgi:hypothetical protein
MTLKLLFLGQLDLHQLAFLPFLSKHHYDITVVNTSHWSSTKKILGTDIPVCNLYENGKIHFLFKGTLECFTKAAVYSLAEKTKLIWRSVKKILEQQDIEVIYGSWGSCYLQEMKLARKFNIPLVYEFLTYPNNIFDFAVKIENTFNRSIINNLNGRILASHAMLNYMRKMFKIRNGKNIVFMERYPAKFFYHKRLPRLSEKDGHPHLVFIGLDLNDVFPQIEELTRRKIHVHVCDPKRVIASNRLKTSEFLHTFNQFYFNKICDGTFATFMTQFDACLVTYNFQRASNLDRFYNSVPNRFSLALTAGVPLVLPRGYLTGCEGIVNEHQIGFTYTSYDDLEKKLSDERLMGQCRKNAFEKSRGFFLENTFVPIDRFLRESVHKQNDLIGIM